MLAMDVSSPILIAEDDLYASEAHFRSMYENATIGMYRTTPDGRILIANPAAVRMFGAASLEALSQRNIEQDGFADEESCSAYRAQLARDGMVSGLESSWLRQDGSLFGVRVSAHTIC